MYYLLFYLFNHTCLINILINHIHNPIIYILNILLMLQQLQIQQVNVLVLFHKNLKLNHKFFLLLLNNLMKSFYLNQLYQNKIFMYLMDIHQEMQYLFYNIQHYHDETYLLVQMVKLLLKMNMDEHLLIIHNQINRQLIMH